MSTGVMYEYTLVCGVESEKMEVLGECLPFHSNAQKVHSLPISNSPRMQDPKSGLSYGELFNSIACTLNVKFSTLRGYVQKSGRGYYVIKARCLKSKDVLRNYFDTYPLLTSKYLDIKDWCKVDDNNLKEGERSLTFQAFLNSKMAWTKTEKSLLGVI